jgi:predicted metal-dependent hydrolase
MTQLPLPVLAPARPSRRVLSIGGRAYQVTIARHRWARRYVLRVMADGTLRLTVPRGASISGGLDFAEGQAEWIARERTRQQSRSAPWRDGTTVWFRGERETLRVAGAIVAIGGHRIADLDPSLDLRPAIERHFAALSAIELPPRLSELAAAHGLNVARVSIRNQRSRWGACSPHGVITLNWRLVQMPASVSDYVILHELMHLRQPNHSRRFWREVEAVCGWWRDAERWLRRHGREIL